MDCFQVTMLLPNFTEAEASQATEDSTRIRAEINDYNRRFSGEPRPVSQLAYNVRRVSGAEPERSLSKAKVKHDQG